jgi:ABC-2 type transport system ATP-binding protein
VSRATESGLHLFFLVFLFKLTTAGILMLRLESITKSFYKTVALDSVSFDLKPGELTLLLGPNGAGKTTLNQIIAGLLFADRGDIRFKDTYLTTGTRIPYSIGWVGDNEALDPNLTVIQTLLLISRLKDTPNPEIDAELWLNKFELEDVRHSRIHQLSLGFRQRVSLAQAFLGNPDLLLLDEPGNGLDPEQFAKLEEILIEEKQNRIILVSTHRIKEAERLADRLILLNRGQVLSDGTKSSILEKLNLTPCHISIKEDALKLKQYFDQKQIPYESSNESIMIPHWKEEFQKDFLQYLMEENLSLQKFSLMEMSLQELFLRVFSNERRKSL